MEERSPDPRPLDSVLSASGAEDPGALPLLIGLGVARPPVWEEASVVLEMALGVLPFLGAGVAPSEDLGWGFGVDLGFGVEAEAAFGVEADAGLGVEAEAAFGVEADAGLGVEADAGLGVDLLGLGVVGIAGIFSGSASPFNNSSILAPQFSHTAKESSISKWHLGQVHI